MRYTREFLQLQNSLHKGSGGWNCCVNFMIRVYRIKPSSVRDKGSFSFGKLVRVNPEIGASTRKEVTNIVNHERFDYIKEDQKLSGGEQILSKVAYLTELDKTLKTFWSPGNGDKLVNLDGAVISEKLLSTLYPNQYSKLLSAVDDDVRIVMKKSCQPTFIRESGVKALDLL